MRSREPRAWGRRVGIALFLAAAVAPIRPADAQGGVPESTAAPDSAPVLLGEPVTRAPAEEPLPEQDPSDAAVPTGAQAQVPATPADAGGAPSSRPDLPASTDPAAGALPAAPSEPSAAAGVAPDTVTVGDRFRVVVRVRAPGAAAVAFPPFELVEPVEGVDSVRVRRDSADSWTASYQLVAWVPSDSLVASIPFRVRAADGSSRDLRVRVDLPHVRSVLPADSSLHQPRPARAVMPIVVAAPVIRGWLVPGLLLLLVLVGILWFLLRRRTLLAAAPTDPRAAALARLRAIEAEGLLARGEVHTYHVRTSRVLREYLAAAAGLGEDLTSAEVLGVMSAGGTDRKTLAALERLLREADRVKFAGAASAGGGGSGRTHGEAVAEWIAAWPADAAPAPIAADPDAEAA